MTNLRTGLLALSGAVLTIFFALFLATAAYSQGTRSVGQVLDSFVVPDLTALVQRDSALYDHLQVDDNAALVFKRGQDCTTAELAAAFHTSRNDIPLAVFQLMDNPADNLLVFLSQPGNDGSRVLIASNFVEGQAACLVLVLPVLEAQAS